MENIFVQGGAVMVGVNLIVGFVSKWVPKKWLPVIALLLPSVAGGIYAATQGLPVINTILMGLTVGGASMGTYDIYKKVIKNK